MQECKDVITTGANGILNTDVNNTPIPSGDSLTAAAELQSYLNAVFRQAVVSFTVESKGPKKVNYDLTRNGMLDYGNVNERNEILNNASHPTADYNVFVVHSIKGAAGFAACPGWYAFVQKGGKGGSWTTKNTIAHELGHAFGGLPDIKIEGQDDENLMSWSRIVNGWRLRKHQWDSCNPN